MAHLQHKKKYCAWLTIFYSKQGMNLEMGNWLLPLLHLIDLDRATLQIQSVVWSSKGLEIHVSSHGGVKINQEQLPLQET